MALNHGKNTVIILNGQNLSPYCDNSDLDRNSDVHDVTTYGKNSHVNAGGLLGGKGTMGGVYDTAAAGPRAVIRPLIGTTVPLIRRTEGTGSGKPQDSVNVVVNDYKESNPIADYVRWSCEMTLSDDVNSTPQP